MAKRIKTDHVGAKNGGGYWGKRGDAKKLSKKLRRAHDKTVAAGDGDSAMQGDETAVDFSESGEWVETTLDHVTEFLSGGTPSKARSDYWGGSVPWVSAKDMKRFRLDDTEDHLTEVGVHNGTRMVPSGSVLILVRGMTLLSDLPICVVNRPMMFNQDVKALRPKSGVRADFIPYLLLGNKDRLLSSVDLAWHWSVEQ